MLGAQQKTKAPSKGEELGCSVFCWAFFRKVGAKYSGYRQVLDANQFFNMFERNKRRGPVIGVAKKEKMKNLITLKPFIAHLSLWLRLM